MQEIDVKIEPGFFKGPVTACEYYDSDHVLIGKLFENVFTYNNLQLLFYLSIMFLTRILCIFL